MKRKKRKQEKNKEEEVKRKKKKNGKRIKGYEKDSNRTNNEKW